MAMLLAACATAPVLPPDSGRTPDPAMLSQWTAKGRIALVAQGEGGSGSFVWQQRSERSDLAFRGPLGAGGLRIVTDGERLEVTDGAGRALDGEAARRALEERLGIDLPLAGLRYWMLGLPAPGSAMGGAAAVLPASGQAGPGAGFSQDGWTVTFEEYRPVAGWSLPARLSATAEGVRVRIVVDDWETPAP
jgi:outer membrane lipoprotein LolB